MREQVRLTLEEIASACGGTILRGEKTAVVSAVTTDSRMCEPTDLFIPIEGEKFDGHDFLLNLASEGKMAGFLTMKDVDLSLFPESVFCIRCANTLYALGKIAQHYRSTMNLNLIAVTGTNGKTTSKEILAAIFSAKYPTLKNEKNYNNEVGVPFTLFKLRPEHRFAIIEMGMNHAGEIARLTAYAKPDCALITNAGEGHLEFLGSVENVAKAKSEIMESLPRGAFIFLNKDCHTFNIMEDAAKKRGLKIVTFGLKDAEIAPSSYTLYVDRSEFTLRGETYSVNLYGIHNLYNLISSVGLALYHGFHADEIRAALSLFSNVGKRSEIIDCGFTLVNDSYNSNPLSLRSALTSIGHIYAAQKKIAVLGDMKELGEKGEYYHREAAREAIESGFAEIYTFGDLAKFTAESAVDLGFDEKKVKHFTEKDEMKHYLASRVAFGDVVLVKGSRSMKMEEVAESLIRR